MYSAEKILAAPPVIIRGNFHLLTPFPWGVSRMILSVVRGLCWPWSADRLLFHLIFCRKWQSAKIDKNRPAGRKPTGRRFEAFCCFLTWYSSYSWPEYSRGGARLFLSGRSGLDYNDSKTAWRRPPVGRHAFNCWEWQKESSGLDFSKPPPVNIN